MNESTIICKECGKKTKQITYAHLKTHNMTMKEYFEKYPNAPLRAPSLQQIMIDNQIKSQYSSNKCEICGNEIAWNKKFCSSKCAVSRKKALCIIDYCIECEREFSKPISKDTKFCSRECYDKYRQKNSTESVINHVLKKNNNSCILCGAFENIRVHHINENRKDNTEENLTVLCESCHRKVHNGLSVTVYKTFIIEIAHNLIGHPTCGVIHGHSAKITVGVNGPLNLKTGMVIDFKILKQIIKEIVIDKFDHSYLNDTLPIPTAEILSYYIFLKLSETGLNVEVVRFHETEDNYAEFKIK